MIKVESGTLLLNDHSRLGDERDQEMRNWGNMCAKDSRVLNSTEF